MPGSVCVDASVVLQIVTPEEQSAHAEALWAGWISQGRQPVAPPTFHLEVCSVLRQKVQLRGELPRRRQKRPLRSSWTSAC